MRRESITLVIEPGAASVLTERGREPLPKRRLHEYDKFAGELRAHVGPVVVVENSLAAAAVSAGMVLLDPSNTLAASLAGCAEEERRTLPPRLVLLNADRGQAAALLEQYRLAGAVELLRYCLWRTEPRHDARRGLYGLRSVAAELGAEVADLPGRASKDYCELWSDRYPDLPSLLAAYLAAHAETLAAPSGRRTP